MVSAALGTPVPRVGQAEQLSVAAVPAGGKTRILVVEDDPFVRGGILCLVNRQPDLVCCGEAGSCAEILPAIAALNPGLLLLDLCLADGEAFDLIPVVRKRHPHVAILVLSQYDERVYAPRVLAAGAGGYIMKEAAASDLVPAIHQVLAAKVYLSSEMTSRLFSPPV